MDRFRWCSTRDLIYEEGEILVFYHSRVRIYEGSERTGYENGHLQLTNFRIIWTDSTDPDTVCLSLPLLAISSSKVQMSSTWAGTHKVSLNLLPDSTVITALRSLSLISKWAHEWLDPSLAQSCRIQTDCISDLIRFGFVSGAGYREFDKILQEQLVKKTWQTTTSKNSFKGGGIGAIERARAAKLVQTDQNISRAFEDLDQLMKSAAEMVKISKELSRKIQEKKELDLDKDAIEEFRNAMLTMGVEEATNKKHNETIIVDESNFHVKLAREICALLIPDIKKECQIQKKRKVQLDWSNSGCIDLTSAYCRINRARGLDLISPKDLLKAAEAMTSMNLPLRLKTFSSGIKILHLATEDEVKTLRETLSIVQENKYISAHQFSKLTGLLPIIARERLLMAEENGLLCRDDSYYGLIFYPNCFV